MSAPGSVASAYAQAPPGFASQEQFEKTSRALIGTHMDAQRLGIMPFCVPGRPAPLFAVSVTNVELTKDGAVKSHGDAVCLGPLKSDAKSIAKLEDDYLAKTVATVRARLASPPPGVRFNVIVRLTMAGNTHEMVCGMS